MKTRKINLSIKFILLFVIMIILFLPVNGLSVQIKSMKVIKTGTPDIHEDKIKSEWNRSSLEHGGDTGSFFTVDPYSVRRPVMVRVTYSCDKTPKKISSKDIESYQEKDKWGDWVTNTYGVKETVQKQCGEKTDEQIRYEESERIRQRQQVKENMEYERIREKVKKEVEQEWELKRIRNQERVKGELEPERKLEGERTREWIYFGHESDGEHYYDNQNMKIVRPYVIEEWDKVIISDKEKSNVIQYCNKKLLSCDGVTHYISLSEINCYYTIKTHKEIKSIYYDDKGNPVFMVGNERGHETDITKYPSYLVLVNKVCPKLKELGEKKQIQETEKERKL